MAEKPHLVVSVDLGTTYTGVAWMAPGRSPPQVINDWPGSGDRGERKVPTCLIYNSDDTLSSWGFMCEDDEMTPEKTRREFFKIFIDRETLNAAQEQGLNAPKSSSDAERFATDYLREIYVHIKKTIEIQTGKRHIGGWADLVVSFLFSVPTTWTRMEVVNTFKRIIRDAGFGIEGQRHSAQVDLTEAEAAAVATLKTTAVDFNVGSLFLTVDAGGGTTDLALMNITSTDPKFPQMAQMAAVKGVGIGSTLIDRAFIRMVSKRLLQYPEVMKQLPGDCALRMSRSHYFRTVKHKFGETVYMQPVFKIQMDGVSYDFSHDGLRIQNGRMLFTLEEFQALFDMQIDGIMRRIREQLDWLSVNGHLEQVEYMILSGGLGSSAYVREQLQRLVLERPHPNATTVAVVPCPDPQLIVVRGLLLDQQQRLESGSLSVLATRIARASYGVLIRETYTPALHFNEDIIPDPYDYKQKWAINQIQWLIRKGDQVNTNSPLVKSFEIHLSQDDTTRSWDAEIVISQNEPTFLPRSIKHAGVTRLCKVKSNLDGVKQHELILKHKRGTCFQQGRKYYICKFDIQVIVAPADLRFELWFGGVRFSGNHEPISIKWDENGVRVKSE